MEGNNLEDDNGGKAGDGTGNDASVSTGSGVGNDSKETITNLGIPGGQNGGTKKRLGDISSFSNAFKKRATISRCEIPSCNEESVQLTFASIPVMTYFRIQDKCSIIKVCPKCVLKANDFEKKAKQAILKGECLFNLEHEPQLFPQTVNIDNEFSGDDSGPIPRKNKDETIEVDFERTEVTGIVNSFLQKVKIKDQMQSCTRKLTEEAETLKNDMDSLEATIKLAEDTLFNACNKYNSVFDTRPRAIVIEEVEINADGSVRKKPVADPASPFDHLKPTPVASHGVQNLLGLEPCPSIIPRIPPKVHDIVYSMNKSLEACWVQAEIIKTVENPFLNQTEYIVLLEPTKNGIPTGKAVSEVDGSVRLELQVCLKELAYVAPPPFLLPVGTRVIAKYLDHNRKGCHYAGVVGERISKSSNYRYLIFFDDGYLQYVTPDNVNLVCEVSNCVWNDVHPHNYEFIKKYVSDYPEWPMVKLRVDDLVSTEWNGMWFIARIIELDCSLAKVKFENNDREEWIYRGSARFKRVQREIERKEERKNMNNENRKIPLKNHQAANIETMRELDNSNTSEIGTLAKKSTAGKVYKPLSNSSHSEGINIADPDSMVEFQGMSKVINLPDTAIKPRDFTAHDCNPDCVIPYVPTEERKCVGPLQIPLMFGWAREVGKLPRQTVFYRAPCGLRLRDYDELCRFLKLTNSNLPIDLFCFDHNIQALNRFIPTRVLHTNDDISDGKELVPIQCVNSLDNETLPTFDYLTEPVLGANTELPHDNDDGFLTCCDCVDNCEDKTKCACWLQTMEGISFSSKMSKPEYPTKGYEYRRLREHVVSGIYECNHKCKCKTTCTNRVVQNGVKWPVQLFKTAKKGWGIRALFDMPEGIFICVYAGEIFTDQTWPYNEHQRADEYLADLDFIEVNENIKADYESDVTDIEDDDEHDDEDKEECSTSLQSNLPITPTRSMFAARRTGGSQKESSHVINSDNCMINRKKKRNKKGLREFYDSESRMYLIDSKHKGNFGKYMNHSCKPNVFVQNVFVESHDLRLPKVAFFTSTVIKAGTELTWDYHYDIGSVPGVTKFCYCLTPYCRNRLL